MIDTFDPLITSLVTTGKIYSFVTADFYVYGRVVRCEKYAVFIYFRWFLKGHKPCDRGRMTFDTSRLKEYNLSMIFNGENVVKNI